MLSREAGHDARFIEGNGEMGKGSDGGSGKHLTTSPGHIRHLDLDDFANSPAADADDRSFEEGDDRDNLSGKVGEGEENRV